MAFIPNPKHFVVKDKVKLIGPLTIPQGTFTSGHEFTIKSIIQPRDQRDSVAYELFCETTGYYVTAYKNNIEKVAN